MDGIFVLTPPLIYIPVIMADVDDDDRFIICVFKILARPSFVLDHMKSVAKIFHPHMSIECKHAMGNCTNGRSMLWYCENIIQLMLLV